MIDARWNRTSNNSAISISLDDSETYAPTGAEISFQPNEIRRRRENRRLDNEMFVAYELKVATEEDRKEYGKLKEKMEKQEYREMQNHCQPPPQQHQQHPRHQDKYRHGPPSQPSYNAAHLDNPHPRHSYDWEKEEYARRHSRQYEEQKELQKAFIEGELNGENIFDPFQQEMKQSQSQSLPQSQQQYRTWNQKSIRRPGRNADPFQNESGDFHQYRSSYYQNPYLHEDPLVMGGNLGGTTARAGRQPPSPENIRRPRRRPGTSFPTRGGVGGSMGPLFAHDPFLTSIFGFEDDVPYRSSSSHGRHEDDDEGRPTRNTKGAPSNNHIWGV
jgi:hypothetical protein